MKRLIQATAFLDTSGTFAQDFDAGLRAYNQGDYGTALKEWTPLAEHGDTSAQYNIGIMHDNGQGVPQDHAEAVRWYRLAAEQGNAEAQYKLGMKYFLGGGVPQDFISAHMWWNLAAATGIDEAADNRNTVARDMTPESIAEAQRRAKVCLASNYQDCD